MRINETNSLHLPAPQSNGRVSQRNQPPMAHGGNTGCMPGLKAIPRRLAQAIVGLCRGRPAHAAPRPDTTPTVIPAAPRCTSESECLGNMLGPMSQSAEEIDLPVITTPDRTPFSDEILAVIHTMSTDQPSLKDEVIAAGPPKYWATQATRAEDSKSATARVASKDKAPPAKGILMRRNAGFRPSGQSVNPGRAKMPGQQSSSTNAEKNQPSNRIRFNAKDQIKLYDPDEAPKGESLAVPVDPAGENDTSNALSTRAHDGTPEAPRCTSEQECLGNMLGSTPQPPEDNEPEMLAMPETSSSSTKVQTAPQAVSTEPPTLKADAIGAGTPKYWATQAARAEDRKDATTGAGGKGKAASTINILARRNAGPQQPGPSTDPGRATSVRINTEAQVHLDDRNEALKSESLTDSVDSARESDTGHALSTHEPVRKPIAQGLDQAGGGVGQGVMAESPAKTGDKPANNIIASSAHASSLSSRVNSWTSSPSAVKTNSEGETYEVSLPYELWGNILMRANPADRVTFLREVSREHAPGVVANMVRSLDEIGRALTWVEMFSAESASNRVSLFTDKEKFHFLVGAYRTFSEKLPDAGDGDRNAYLKAQTKAAELLAPLWPEVGQEAVATFDGLLDQFPPSRNLHPQEAKNWQSFLLGAMAHTPPDLALQLAARLWLLVYPRNESHTPYPEMRNEIVKTIDETIKRTTSSERWRLMGLRNVEKAGVLARRSTSVDWSSYGCPLDVLVQLLKAGHLRSVESVDLNNSGVTTVPPALFDLPNLKRLVLRCNESLSLTTLVDAIGAGKCDQLEDLGLSYCNLKTIPDEIFNLPELRALELRYNSGLSLETLAAAARNGKLRKLEVLGLHSCGVKDVPPEILALPALKSITIDDLFKNQLGELKAKAHMPVPAHIVDSLKLFNQSHLDWSSYACPIGALTQLLEAGHLRSVESLDLGKSGVTTVPPAIFDLPNLKRLVLRSNESLSLTTLVDAIGAGKCDRLEDIGLSYCNLKTIPDEIFDLPELRALELRYNSGLSLETLAAAARNGKLRKLEVLGLHSCGVKDVPPEILALPALKSITIDHLFKNQLGELKAKAHMPVPAHIVDSLKLFNQSHLDWSSYACPIGALTQLLEAGHLRSVEWLDLGNSGVTTVPPSIFDLPNLKRLVLRSNESLSLTTLVDAIGAGKCDRLEDIVLSSCNLKTIPDEIFDLPELRALDLRYNSGLSLDSLAAAASNGKLQKLEVLDLYSCGVKDVPREILALPALKRITMDARSQNQLADLRTRSTSIN